MVKVAKQGLDSVSCFFGMVKWNTSKTSLASITSQVAYGKLYHDVREQVVNNMILNNSMEKVASNETKFSVHRGQCSLNECPVASIEMRHLHVGVV